jgi:ABC-type ATPase with predicted acetyltransferase domain
MRLSVAYDFLPRQQSARTRSVMNHFGVDAAHGQHVIAEAVELDLRPGDVALFTGPSGSGKSSLLRACVEAWERESVGELEPESAEEKPSAPTLSHSHAPTVLWIDHLPLPDQPLVDVLPLPLPAALALLAACGLGEAQVLLRTPAELSDGQRYRFRLALGIAECSWRPQWLVADEFAAMLDRTLAKVLAANVRRLATRTGIGFLLATAHEDLAADLDPDLHVRCDLAGPAAVVRRPSSPAADDSSCAPHRIPLLTIAARRKPTKHR